jgi:ribose-phosphate pyrophosphokinase
MIKVNGEVIKIEHYPDGTQKLHIDHIFEWCCCDYNIDWRYEKEEELSSLIYITRHLKQIPNCRIFLKMFYLPNARMDRVQSWDEVFTLKGFADVINWLEFDSVKILDVHSNVGAAVFNKLTILLPEAYIANVINEINNKNSDLILYFPDAGAAKRYSNMFPEYKYCYGEKKRDWDTGKILGLDIKSNGINLSGKTILMIDDIVAYGGSLYYSANTLKNWGVDKIYAFATHTENSVLNREKGTLIKSLEDNTVERLFTTDSIFTGKHEKITVMEV